MAAPIMEAVVDVPRDCRSQELRYHQCFGELLVFPRESTQNSLSVIHDDSKPVASPSDFNPILVSAEVPDLL